MTRLTIQFASIACFSGGFVLRRYASGASSLSTASGCPLSMSYAFGENSARVEAALRNCANASEMVAVAQREGATGFEILEDVEAQSPVDKALADLVEQVKPHVRAGDMGMPVTAILRALADRIEDAAAPRGRRRKLGAV